MNIYYRLKTKKAESHTRGVYSQPSYFAYIDT